MDVAGRRCVILIMAHLSCTENDVILDVEILNGQHRTRICYEKSSRIWLSII